MAELSATSLIGSVNLKAYYKLEVGALTTDEKATYTLTNTNTVGDTASGKYGGAADFSAANSDKFLVTTDNLGIDGGAMTMTGWFKIRAEPGSGVSYMCFNQANQTSDTEFYLRYTNSGGTLRLEGVRDQVGIGGVTLIHNVTLGTTDWHHIVLTYNATTLEMYLDGVLVDSDPASGNGNSNPAAGFSIGASINAGGNFASYYADDVAVFDTGLSEAQILELYNPPVVGGVSRGYSFII